MLADLESFMPLDDWSGDPDAASAGRLREAGVALSSGYQASRKSFRLDSASESKATTNSAQFTKELELLVVVFQREGLGIPSHL